MAKVPQLSNLKSDINSSQIVNAVLNDSNNAHLFSSLPRVSSTDTNQATEQLHTIGDILSTNQNVYNAFIDTLFNRIIMTVIQTVYFTNPLRRVKRGFLEAGDIVEEIAFKLIAPHDYNSTPDNAYPKQEKPEVATAIHKINYQKYYKTTVNKKDLLRAFVTYNGMEEFVREQISLLYTSAELDEYVATKYMLGRAVLKGYILGIQVPAKTNPDFYRTLSIKMRALANNMELLKTKYNFSHMPQTTRKNLQLVILNTDVEAALDVNVLAEAYNLQYADFNRNRLLLDDWSYEDVRRMNELFGNEIGYTPFTSQELALLNSIDAFVVDERFFMIFDAEFEMTSFFNPEKLYHNFWLHTWKIMSFSTFVNAVVFSNQVAQPATITITGNTTATAGNSVPLTATFNYGNSIPSVLPLLTWQITTTVTNTVLEPLGDNKAVLKIGNSETATSITVKASFNSDDGTEIAGTFTVTLSQPSENEA